MLAVTGAEALYADMGHFGRKPIRFAWLFIVLPGLMLNYFGQGALIIEDPKVVRQVFFELVPQDMVLALVILSTLAADHRLAGGDHRRVLADAAGDPARLPAAHGDPAHVGDRDRPDLRPAGELDPDGRHHRPGGRLRFVGQAGRRLRPCRDRRDAGRRRARAWRWRSWCWKWKWPVAAAVFGLLAIPDLAFFIANALKIPDGGWLPLLVAGLVFFTITTWRRGRELVGAELAESACRCRSSSTAWSAHPIASPARRCS